jgi:predicted ArsR family transcriptional regulator
MGRNLLWRRETVDRWMQGRPKRAAPADRRDEVLHFLRDHGPAPTLRIAEHLGLKRSGTRLWLDRLVSAGAVRRHQARPGGPMNYELAGASR